MQNYPNPFNPSTSIRFNVLLQGFVSLKMYDVTGKIISEPVNEVLAAGEYEINWNAFGKPSGVYFYRLEVHSTGLNSGGFTDTKKMILVK